VDLTVTAPVTHVYSDQAVTFTYVVTNNGSQTATNLDLSVTLTSPYYQYNDPSGGTVSGNVLTVDVPDLAPGQSATILVGTRVPPTYKDEQKITIPAKVTYDQGSGTGLTTEADLKMPTGQLDLGSLFINVNVVKPGEDANITLVTGDQGYVRLMIYNSAGELVKTLLGQYPATAKELLKRKWDGTNESGDFVASGVYIVYAQMPGVTRVAKVAVLR
jgi:hypothetical protein